MIIEEQRRGVTAGISPIPGPVPTTPESWSSSPTWSDTWRGFLAAAQRENWILSGARNLAIADHVRHAGYSFEISDDFNPFAYFRDPANGGDPKRYERLLPWLSRGVFNEARSPGEAEILARQIEEEERLRSLIDRGGALGDVAGSLLGGLALDPIAWLAWSRGGAAIAAASARSGARGALMATTAVVAAEVVTQEALLHSQNLTRTWEESLINIGGSIVLGAGLGSAFGTQAGRRAIKSAAQSGEDLTRAFLREETGSLNLPRGRAADEAESGRQIVDLDRLPVDDLDKQRMIDERLRARGDEGAVVSPPPVGTEYGQAIGLRVDPGAPIVRGTTAANEEAALIGLETTWSRAERIQRRVRKIFAKPFGVSVMQAPAEVAMASASGTARIIAQRLAETTNTVFVGIDGSTVARTKSAEIMMRVTVARQTEVIQRAFSEGVARMQEALANAGMKAKRSVIVQDLNDLTRAIGLKIDQTDAGKEMIRRMQETYGEAGFTALRREAENAVQAVRQVAREMAEEGRRTGLLRDPKAIKEAEEALRAAQANRKRVLEEARIKEEDLASMAPEAADRARAENAALLRDLAKEQDAEVSRLQRILAEEREKPAVLDEWFGPQVWNRDAVSRHHRWLTGWLADIIAGEPDPNWLRARGMNPEEYAGRLAAGDPEAQRLRDLWRSGGSGDVALRKAEANLEETNRALQDLEVELIALARQQRQSAEEYRKFAHNARLAAVEENRVAGQMRILQDKAAGIRQAIRSLQRAADLRTQGLTVLEGQQEILLAARRALREAQEAERAAREAGIEAMDEATRERIRELKSFMLYAEEERRVVSQALKREASRARQASGNPLRRRKDETDEAYAKRLAEREARGAAATAEVERLRKEQARLTESISNFRAEIARLESLRPQEAAERIREATQARRATERAVEAAERNLKALQRSRGLTDLDDIAGTFEAGRLQRLQEELFEVNQRLEALEGRREALYQARRRAAHLAEKAQADRLEVERVRSQVEAERRAARAEAEKAGRAVREMEGKEHNAWRIAEQIVSQLRHGSMSLDEALDDAAQDGILPIHNSARHRMLNFTPEQVAELDARGLLETNIEGLMNQSIRQWAGHVALRDALGFQEALRAARALKVDPRGGDAPAATTWRQLVEQVRREYDEMRAQAQGPEMLARINRAEADDINAITLLRDRMLGRNLSGMDPSGLGTFVIETMRALPMVAFAPGFLLASMPELVAAWLRSKGDFFRSFGVAISREVRALDDDVFRTFAAQTERADNPYASAMARFGGEGMMQTGGLGTPGTLVHTATRRFELARDWAVAKAQQISGLPQVSRKLREMAGWQALERIRRLAKEAPESRTAYDTEWLAVVGLDEARLQRVARNLEEHGTPLGQTINPNTRAWTDQEALTDFHVAVMRHQDGLVPTAGMATTPRAFSTGLGKLLFMLQSFAFVSMQQVYMPMIDKAVYRGDREWIYFLAGAIPLTMLNMAIRDVAYGRDPAKRYESERWAYEVADRMGLSGFYSPYLDATLKITGIGGASDRFGRNTWYESLLGAPIGSTLRLGEAVGSTARFIQGQDDARQLQNHWEKILPAQILSRSILMMAGN